MPLIRATTLIQAPIARVFQLSLSIDLEAAAEQAHAIRAIAGVTSGIIGPGETVTWRMRQLGVPITHTTLISAHTPPTYFQDRMVRGIFRTFVHDHFFRPISSTQTEMRDELRFSVPLYLTGPIVAHLFAKRRLTTMLGRRNATIKDAAENS